MPNFQQDNYKSDKVTVICSNFAWFFAYYFVPLSFES